MDAEAEVQAEGVPPMSKVKGRGLVGRVEGVLDEVGISSTLMQVPMPADEEELVI